MNEEDLFIKPWEFRQDSRVVHVLPCGKLPSQPAWHVGPCMEPDPNRMTKHYSARRERWVREQETHLVSSNHKITDLKYLDNNLSSALRCIT